MTEFQNKIHQQAVSIARQYKRSELELMQAISEVDKARVYRELGYTSLFAYCTKALGLSESSAYAMIAVERKAKEVPELDKAIKLGEISVSQSKRILSVLDTQQTPGAAVTNQAWIDKTQKLTQRQIEQEIVTQNPKQAVKDGMKYIAEKIVSLKCAIPEELMKKIERVKDIQSQKQSSPCSLEKALTEMAEAYLQKHDPVRKAERLSQAHQKPSSRKAEKTMTSIEKTQPVKPLSAQITPDDSHRAIRHESHKAPNPRAIPAAIRNAVFQRDKGQCQFVDSKLGPCNATRWIELHHIQPLASGGKHRLDNVTSYCSIHHKMWHEGLVSHIMPGRKERGHNLTFSTHGDLTNPLRQHNS